MVSSGNRPQRGSGPNRSAFRAPDATDRGRGDRGASRGNWNQGDREAQRKGRDERKVASAETWEGRRGDRAEGRMQQRNSGRGTQQPGVRGRDQEQGGRMSNERGSGQRDRGRVQQTGETRRTSERGRPEKVGHGEQGVSMRKAPQGAQGISNRAAGRENARQAKVAPERAQGRKGNGGRRRAG